ncbi:alpha-N-acetylgalactosaminide alpha-2,6-sialyltransferase 1 isoform X2 [Manis javanica]|uniref:alpha-N-acetylgalactosaminide alpha-2,6-sialyltransferase 1 isoform X2 n=1 Tax=Manis javanica TaxID=9974 RepID=UPI00187B09D7|nr:alpha-N-acetylgalactosaminide alpha-2,6-sialyltransferase 1 isoform X2 [Manis javanica]
MVALPGQEIPVAKLSAVHIKAPRYAEISCRARHPSMKLCRWRLGPLGRAVRWLLLLALLLFLLLALPSLVKEPSTKPSRHQNMENMKERSLEWLQNATPQAPTAERRTAGRAASAQGDSKLGAGPVAAGHPADWRARAGAVWAIAEERGSMPGTAKPPSWKSRDTAGDMLSWGWQGGEMASDRTEVLSLKSWDRRTTRGRRGWPRKPAAPRTAPGRHWGKGVATAKMPIGESQAEVWTTPGPTGRRTGGAAPTGSQATLPSAPFQGLATQRGQRLRASNFRSEPQWDFEENYSLDIGGRQTTCPDSLKVKASKSLWFRKLFLANLTLFLDSRHFNRSEWDRLEHFAPPFGFMELNFSLVQNVVTRFPPVAEQQLLLASLPAGSSQCISCAVVGNGGILNNSRMGREIDGHDYVFRLSGAVIKGYEQDVGTRTSFYGFTAFSLTQSLIILGSRGFQHVPLGKDVHYLHFLEGTRDYEWLEALLLNQTLVKNNLWSRRRPLEAFREALHLDRYMLLHPDLLRYMKNRFLRSKTLKTAHWRIYRPTTGALMLLTALQLCDQVSAYGFITEGHEHFSNHYYDKSWKKTIFYINHDFNLEKTLWKRLHDEGIIWLYKRPVTSTPKI